MRLFKAIFGLMAMLLLFTGCLKVDGNIKIEDDGTGSVDFLSAIDKDAVSELLGGFGDLSGDDSGFADDEICNGFSDDMTQEGIPNNATVTPYDQDGFCGTRVVYSLPASLDHSAAMTDLFEESARLYKEGDNWFFETAFTADDITSSGDDFGMDAGSLFGDASFRITLDLPGKATNGLNNATEVGDDGVFIWEIDLLDPPTRIFAQTEPGSGGGSGGGDSGDGGGISPMLIGLVLVGLLGLGALAWFLTQRGASSGAQAAAPTGTAGFEPPTAGMTPPTAAMPAPAPGTVEPVQTQPVQTQPMQSTAGATIADTAAMLPVIDDAAAKETVMINPADLQASTDQAAQAAQAAQTTQAATPSSDPVWDETLGAWTVNDPARGLLRHDPATDSWNPA